MKYLPRVLILCFLSVFFLPPQPCLACSCGQFRPAEEIGRASVIFRGRVTNIATQPAGNRTAVTFQVDLSWKGPVTPEMVVVTGRHTVTCGFPFRQGEEYLVLAGSGSGEIETGLCSGTSPVPSRWTPEYFLLLGPGTPVGAPPPPQMPHAGAGGTSQPRPFVGVGAVSLLFAGVAFVLRRLFPNRLS